MPTGIYEKEGRVLGKIKTTCLNCGCDIFDHASRRKQFCNRVCYEEYIRKNHIIPDKCRNTGRTRFKKGLIPWNKGKSCFNGKDNPAYKHGKTRKFAKKMKILNGPNTWKKRLLQKIYKSNITKYGKLTCEYCTKQIAIGKETIDHKIPLSRGGQDIFKNMIISCHPCNSGKREKTYEEYKKFLKEGKQ